MSRVAKLPDGFDESKISGQLPAADEDESTTDDLYDRAMANGGLTNKSFEEALSEISKTPLFMSSLESAGDDSGSNDMLEALQALQYEGTKSEVAQNFKVQGNEQVGLKKWTDAREFYSKGLTVLLVQDEGKWDKAEDMGQELQTRQDLKEQLYSNRARCNLELQNYRSTILDCAAAIRLNPSNVKAHFRSATALLALDKVYDALDVCYRGMKIDSSNSAMRTLLEQIQKRSRVKEAQDKKRKEERQRRNRERSMLATALKARNINVRGSERPPNMADASVKLVPDPLSPESTLEFPVMLLYPMHNQSDFVQAYSEQDSLQDHLSYILPLPWDQEKQYRKDDVECFMDTLSGGILKIGKKLSLLEVLSGGKTEVVDSLVRIYVVPKALSQDFLAEVKKKRLT